MENRKRYFKKRFVSLMLTVFLLIVISILKIGNFGGNFEELFNTANLNDVDIETSNNVETNALANLDQKLSVHFIDQTTPNMIQRISGIFEVNPLILKGI